jgi:hypothetical protein
MKKTIVPITILSAVFFACLAIQGCSDTAYETEYGPPYVASSYYSPHETTYYGPYYGPYGYTTYSYNTYPAYEYEYPPYRTTTVYRSEPDSVVGSTAHAVGTVVAAPFRIVGDVVDTIL